VTHSKRLALREGMRLIRNSVRFLRNYRQLRTEWEEGYDRLTTGTYWNDALHIAPTKPSQKG
ncbi:hypothetical protein, partial [Rhodalgimonas zhirmunskyi]